MSLLSSNNAGFTPERVLVKFFTKAHKAWKKGENKQHDRIGQELREGDYVIVMDEVMLYSNKNYNLGIVTGFTKEKVKVKRASYKSIPNELFEKYEINYLRNLEEWKETSMNGTMVIKLTQEQVYQMIKD